MLSSFISRLNALFGRRKLRQNIDDELAFHQAMLRDRLRSEGANPEDLDLAERRQFGKASRWAERLHEQWQFEPAENLFRDIGFALRVLRKAPAFTAVAILTLAIGIGANTAIFSVVNGLLFRDLLVPHPEQLVMLSQSADTYQSAYFGAPLFRTLERHHPGSSTLFGFFNTRVQVRGNSGNERIDALLVSGDFFSGMQILPQLGRPLTPADDIPGGNPAGSAIVISDSFWTTWFARAPDVIGRSLTVSGVPFTIVGVTPKTFTGPVVTSRPQIYVPMALEPAIDAPYSMTDGGFNSSWLNISGRLQPGVTLDQLNAELRTTSHALLVDAQPAAGWLRNAEKGHFHFAAESGAHGFSYLRKLFRKPLLAILAMCGIMLLLACLNLASLLMARAAHRQHELATRRALGATRGRLLQQLMTESLLLCAAGAAAGLLLAPFLSGLITRMLFGQFSGTVLDVSLDTHLFLFASTITIAAVLLTGLLPAFSATRNNLSAQMKDGIHATADRARTRRLLPRLLLALEVALSLLLVTGAALLATSLLRLKHSGLGFDPGGLANIGLVMEKQPLDGPPLTDLYRRMGETIAVTPGIQSVSFQSLVPLSHSAISYDFHAIDGHTLQLDMNRIAPAYFKTMRTPLLSGREFAWTDAPATGLKIILNQSAAAALFPGRNPIGESLPSFDRKQQYQVLGIVGDLKYHDLREAPKPAGYFAITQDDSKKPSYSVLVRYTGSSADMAASARRVIAQLAPDIPAPVFTTMSADIDNSIATERMLAFLSVFFAACALLVTAIGLYGTLAYNTALRTNEIGIRMALGAQRRQVVLLVLRGNLSVAAVGTVLGLAIALSATRVLASFLYGTPTRDPWTILGCVILLLSVSSAASLLPALRAAHIDPSQAMRSN